MNVPDAAYENIVALCLTCTMTFVTSRDSYENDESRCPACGEQKNISERDPLDD